MATLLVIGGTGAVGGFLLERLRAAGHTILALSRSHPPPQAGVEWIPGALAAMPALPPFEAILCAGPLDQFTAWLDAAAPPGLRRVVALSSMSAASKQDSADAAERELAQRLIASEQRLARRCEALDAAWTLLRPTLIYGAGMDRSLTPLVRLARRYRVFPRLPGATGLRQPVHADDVAAACVAALAGGAGQVFELGGGERLSYAQMLQRVRASLGVPAISLPLPISLLRLATRISGRGRGMVQRLTQDLVADNRAAEAAIGYGPRPFRPAADSWAPLPPHPHRHDMP